MLSLRLFNRKIDLGFPVYFSEIPDIGTLFTGDFGLPDLTLRLVNVRSDSTYSDMVGLFNYAYMLGDGKKRKSVQIGAGNYVNTADKIEQTGACNIIGWHGFDVDQNGLVNFAASLAGGAQNGLIDIVNSASGEIVQTGAVCLAIGRPDRDYMIKQRGVVNVLVLPGEGPLYKRINVSPFSQKHYRPGDNIE